MSCVSCGKNADPEWDLEYTIIGTDGDYACSKACHQKYLEDRQYFFDHILPDEAQFLTWLKE